MSAARDRIVERRLTATHAGAPRFRRVISIWLNGHVHTGWASTHKLPSGRRYNLRIRLWRRFHTVPMFDS
jgi:hypothetical protein